MKPKVELRKTIIDLYQSGLTMRQIASRLGFKSSSAIAYHIKEANIKGRPFSIGELNRGKYNPLSKTRVKAASARTRKLERQKQRDPSIARHFYNSAAWHRIRSEVFKRDKYTCQLTHTSGIELECHHIVPRHKLPKEQWLEKSNLITLSKAAHTLTKGKEEQFQFKVTS